MSATRTVPYSPLEGESKLQSSFGGGYPASHVTVARQLRKAATPWEVKLWQQLKGARLGAAFRRQQPVGPYIVDFVCLERQLVIELDGSQHQQQEAQDNARDQFLVEAGYCVLRFWNNDIDHNLDNVLQRIGEALTPHQNATRFDSPSRGE